MNSRRKLEWFCALLFLIALVSFLSWFLWKTGALDRLDSLEHIQEVIDDCAPWSHGAFFLLQLSGVIIAPIPSNFMAMAGGACFGLLPGFLMTFCAVTLGSFLTFSLARALGREWVQKFVSRKISDRYLSLMERKRDSFLVLVFLFPFFPDDLICILAGLTDIPRKRFVLIVLLTRHWGLFVASALGGSLTGIPVFLFPLLVLVGIGMFLLGMKYGDLIEEKILNRFEK